MKNNPLSEIYSSKVLLSEEKSPVVKGNKELESKIGKATLVKGQGADKKKEIETPKEDKKYSDGAKAKNMTKESTQSLGGAFEKLFKATINEENELETPEISVPTNQEDMVDEIENEGGQEGDLVSDLRDIVDRLNDVLSKLSEEENSEEEMDEENSEEENSEEENSEEENSEEENRYQESVSVENKGHALHNLKINKDLLGKNNKVPGKIKASGGSVYNGELKDAPEPKELGDKKGNLQSKKGQVVSSSVKTGDFFK